MKKIITTLLTLSIVFYTVQVFAKNTVIGTGSQAGLYYPYGGALAKIWTDNIEGLSVKPEVTAASLFNTIKVAKGKMIAGLAQGNVVSQAFYGKNKFKSPLDVRVLFALYPNVVQIVVPADSNIYSIYDLKGKSVSLGAPGSGTQVTAKAIISTFGIKNIDKHSLNYSETAEGLVNGQLEAGFIVGGKGLGVISELALRKKIRIISFTEADMAKLVKVLPDYSSFNIAENTYNNVPMFQAPSVWNVIVVHKDLNEQTAYEMAKSAYENMKNIQATLSVAKDTTPENANRLSAVPLHDGTLRYLKEIGKL